MGPPYHVAKRAVRIFGGILDVGKHEHLFFGLHPMFGGKLNAGRREDLFWVFTQCLGDNWTSGPRKMISGGHALPSFGPG